MMSISFYQKGIGMKKNVWIVLLSLSVLPAWAQTGSASHVNKLHGKPQPKASAGLHAPQPQPQPETRLGEDELAIAGRVHQGHLACELGASVRLVADATQPGYFDLQGKGYRYRMHPVATTTGAIRLEDKKAGTVWLQLANKSMLMDQNKGRRIADECAHPEQVAVATAMKLNPPPSLIDTTGMGRKD
jgi:hypothetical protein